MDDLAQEIEARGALLAWAPISQGLYVAGKGDEPPVVIAPSGGSYLKRCWVLAHELGHLLQHAGPRGELLYDKDETAADRWAARALIPRARIEYHGNASMDAFIGALSAHYGDIPLWDCPDRRLAAKIAATRLKWMEAV